SPPETSVSTMAERDWAKYNEDLVRRWERFREIRNHVIPRFGNQIDHWRTISTTRRYRRVYILKTFRSIAIVL
ncbi:MAG: hypothetical protein ACP5HT_07325, partial [Conexivisphaera sp.]